MRMKVCCPHCSNIFEFDIDEYFKKCNGNREMSKDIKAFYITCPNKSCCRSIHLSIKGELLMSDSYKPMTPIGRIHEHANRQAKEYFKTVEDIVERANDYAIALGNAPIQKLDESDKDFIEKYKDWYRNYRHNVIMKWGPLP